MSFSKFLSKIKPKRQCIAKNETAIALFLTWITPAIFIPMGRFIEDKDKPLAIKKELFARDFTTYSIGASLFFAGRSAVRGLVKKTECLKPAEKNILTLGTGVALYNLYAAIGSVRTAKFLGLNKHSKHDNPRVRCYGVRPDSAISHAKVNFKTCNGLITNKEEKVNKLENGSNKDAKNSLLFRSNIRPNTFRQFQTGYPRINRL